MGDLTLATDITRPTGSRRVLARLETLQASSVLLLGVAERSLFKDAESPDALIWTRRVHTLLEKIGQELESAIRDGRTALLAIALIASIAALACGGTRRVPTRPTFDPATAGTLCREIWQDELGRGIDPTGLTGCLTAVRTGQTRDQIAAGVHQSAEAVAYRGRPATPPPVPVVIHGDEDGTYLVRDGQHLRDARGIWRARGFSDFKLLQKVCDGQDIAALLDERISLGANELRVFGMYSGAIGRFVPAEYGDRYWSCLESLLDLTAARQIRIQFTVFADAQQIVPSVDAQRAWLTQIATHLAPHWNVRGELANEAPHPTNGIDPSRFDKPAGRVLWSRGSMLGDADPFRPGWDLIDDHPGRNAEWLRRLHCREFTATDGTSCIESEPMGASETDQPGRRSASVDDFGQFGVGCALLTDGCTFHSDAGIQSERLGPIQRACAERFFAGLRWPPAGAVTWAYQRGDIGSDAGIGQMPLKHRDLPALDGSLRTFCKTNAGQSWCVAMRPGPTWTAQARDGARVINEPFRGWVALTR